MVKSYGVFLCCSLAFLILSLHKEKTDVTIANDLENHSGKINPDTTKNSTFTLTPIVLQIAYNRTNSF